MMQISSWSWLSGRRQELLYEVLSWTFAIFPTRPLNGDIGRWALSPQEVVESWLSVVALMLTPDTWLCNQKAFHLDISFSKASNVSVISGVQVSTLLPGPEIHSLHVFVQDIVLLNKVEAYLRFFLFLLFFKFKISTEKCFLTNILWTTVPWQKRNSTCFSVRLKADYVLPNTE